MSFNKAVKKLVTWNLDKSHRQVTWSWTRYDDRIVQRYKIFANAKGGKLIQYYLTYERVFAQ